MSFVHHHVHTSHSLLDGVSKRADLVKTAKAMGMPAISITDHGTLANHISAYKLGKEHQIKVILGIEAYVAPDSRFNKEYKKDQVEENQKGLHKPSYHLTILAKNKVGYDNLVKLSSLSWREGFYYKPRIDNEILNAHKEGLIVLSGCLGSITSQHIVAGQQDKAIEFLNRYRYMFGEDFYLEVMEHGIPDEKFVCDALVHISKTHGIPLVLTNDSHFTSKEDAKAQEAALNLNNMKVTLNDPAHWSFDGSGYWFKTPQEMADIINKTGWPQEAFHNTLAIANKVEDYAFQTGKHIVPLYRDNTGRQWDAAESHQKLTLMAYEGLANKGKDNDEVYTKRLEYELEVMERKNFSSYFLIIADIIDFMRRRGFLKPFGRGSSVGSLVCYATGITGMDPIRWGVPFERFINEGRKDLPDVDTDISQRHRQEVLRYIAEKYGWDNVAIISTFQQMSVKSVVDKVGRVLGIPSQVRRDLSKQIGELDKDDKLEDVLADNEKVATTMSLHPLWIDICKRLEGNYYNMSLHAAGVVISNDPIWNHVPLARDHKDKGQDEKERGFLTTQYDMNDVQALGLLKLDMLGLTTLDIIADTIKLVEERTGEVVDVHAMNDLDDPKAYEMLASGEYVSTFQGDSSGYRGLARRLRPETFEHIMAFTALYRPGPMMAEKTVDENGKVVRGASILDHYVFRRHGKEPADVWHPLLETVMGRSYGMPLYQEQVVAITKIIAGFTEEEGDTFRKAIGKKDQVLFDKMAAIFIQKGMEKGHSEEFMRGLAQKLSGSARYSWNLGHSAGYGKITYLTGLLEAKYPLEYYVALLNAKTDDAEKLSLMLARIMQKGVRVQPPHINNSSDIFTTDGKVIYMGLSCVRQIGEHAIEAIKRERQTGPFTSFLDFCRRCQISASKAINKTIKENLVKAGAFTWDDTIADGDKLDNVELITKILKKKPNADDLSIAMQLQANGRDITRTERAEFEKAVLSFYISGHPITAYLQMASLFSEDTNVISVSQLKEVGVHYAVSMLGMVIDKEIKLSKRNTNFLKLTVQDQFATNTCIVFDEGLVSRLGASIAHGSIILVQGVTEWSRFREDEIDIKVKDVIQLSSGIPVTALNIDDSKPIEYYQNLFRQNSWKNVTPLASNRWLVGLNQQISINPNDLDTIAKQIGGARLVLGRS